MNLSEKLRKAAILVASLDGDAAQRLLAQMPPETAERVRQLATEMADTPAAERRAVIAEFLGRPLERAAERRQRDDTSLSGEAAVELSLSPAARRQAPRVEEAPTPAGRFDFLRDLPALELAAALQGESPQTIAVVLSQSPATVAADVLGAFPASLTADVVGRIAELDDMDPEILAEIERHLAARFAGELRRVERRKAGAAAVQAILAAAGPLERETILERLEASDRSLARLLREQSQSPRLTVYVAEELDDQESEFDQDFQEVEAVLPAGEDRPESTITARTPESRGHGYAAQAYEAAHDDGAHAATSSERLEFRELEELDNRSLAVLLRDAEPQISLLALAGASRTLVNRILAELSRSDADLLERKMQRIGPVRLRDVEAAQRWLADRAASLAQQGKIRLPARSRRLAVVA